MPATYCVFGEGSNDIGDVEFGNEKAIKQEGCYSGFLRTALHETNLRCLRAAELGNIKQPGSGMKRKVDVKLTGFRRHAYYAARMAETDGADILVIGTDVDRGRGSKTTHEKRVKYLHKYRKELEEGYILACKEKPLIERIRLFVIVPLCQLESWLLADEKAFLKAAGFNRGKLPKKPEEMYGETKSKDILDMLFKNNGYKNPPSTKILFEIAKRSSPDTLSRECPISYMQFYSQCSNPNS